jgi:hypothetical protein
MRNTGARTIGTAVASIPLTPDVYVDGLFCCSSKLLTGVDKYEGSRDIASMAARPPNPF